ncbi:hypothetical protein M5K25_001836 [Dendrobium thyrsiflorum]|uniref:CCHC-type domain-containing protein n=1 Tax=Dendrobium thyrsiflorum TaxID=117978 RepID=A0ABD0VZP9_DENTH
MDNVLSGGPWFGRGHIVGIEKWTPEFSSSSLKGLTSPIWVRMPHLPLACWDEVNVARIASLVGHPLWIDGDMFQWRRRELARVCVRVALDAQLPLCVWVEGSSGRFFKKIEYEKISSFCFKCRRIGHLIKDCLMDAKLDAVDSSSKNVAEEKSEDVIADKLKYMDHGFM